MAEPIKKDLIDLRYAEMMMLNNLTYTRPNAKQLTCTQQPSYRLQLQQYSEIFYF
jgi:hypothetical protein